MKKLLLSLVLATATGSAMAATYDIDPLHTNARFAIDHFNTSTNVGGFLSGLQAWWNLTHKNAQVA